MANLYLTEQGSVLRKTGNRFIVTKDNKDLLDIPCDKIDGVLIFGNVQFTTQAVNELFEHGCELALLSSTGRLKGQLTSITPKNIDLRLKQYECYKDEKFILEISKAIVKAKTNNAVTLLRKYKYNHPEKEFEIEIDKIIHFSMSACKVNSIEELLGYEGACANRYFKLFGNCLLSELRFTGRKKHPSPDPVNAMLSLGYTLIYNEISSLLDGIGFDPYIGYYHRPEFGRMSLGCDIMEEFRAPIVDHLTLNLLNNRVFQSGDFFFHQQSGCMYFKKESMKRYFAEYENFIQREFIHPETGEKTNFRKCFRHQAYNVAGSIKGEKQYKAFEWK